MNSIISFRRIRKPVERQNAEHYLLIALLSFAASVALTRSFLSLTGYPQIGSGTLHVAHLLWGGLALFVAALLPLVLANRWVYTMGALLAGIGVGLFIDEVGKFITRANDYFYAPAAPIIYVFFLLTVLLYLQVRRPPSRDARAALYRALDIFQEVLDRDLDERERAELQDMLRHIADEAGHPDLSSLATALLDFLDSASVLLVPRVPSLWESWLNRARAFESRWIGRGRLRVVLAGGLGGLGLEACISLARLFLAARSPAHLGQMLGGLMSAGRVTDVRGLSWFSAQVTLEGVVGLLLLIAAGLLIAGQDRLGIGLGYLGLVLSLSAVNLLVFYFDQFAALVPATIQFGLLLSAIHYRRRYLSGRT